jgi:hypothetical protein
MRELKGDWRDLFNGFMVALDLRKCFLAFCGIVMTAIFCTGLTLEVGKRLDDTAVEYPRDLVLHHWWKEQCDAWHVIYKGNYYQDIEGRLEKVAPEKEVKGAKAKRQWRLAHVTKHRGGNPWVALGYSVVMVLLFVAVWSYFGGAIARIAAYEIARDGERIETRKALQFSRKKFWSFFWAPLICAIGFLFFAFCNFAGGLVGGVLDLVKAFEVGSILVALLLPLALLSGFIMTLIAVGTLAGAPLFCPAVAAEGTDSFDAVSRGFSYVYSRPWHYVWYQLVSGAYGYVCILFVALFAVTMCHFGLEAGSHGFQLFGAMNRDEFDEITTASWRVILSNEHEWSDYKWAPLDIVRAPHPYGRLQVLANEITGVYHAGGGGLRGGHVVAGLLVTLWLVVTLGLALGYVVSYFISQQTMIYYVLRKKVDGIEMNEVFEETEEEAAKPMEVAKAPGEGAKPPEPPKPAEAPKAEGAPPEPPKENK